MCHILKSPVDSLLVPGRINHNRGHISACYFINLVPGIFTTGIDGILNAKFALTKLQAIIIDIHSDTRAPAIRANSMAPRPIGPAPTTKTNSFSATAARRTPCAPMANGSNEVISIYN